MRGRQACFGLAQVHRCTDVQVYGHAGQFQVPISRSPTCQSGCREIPRRAGWTGERTAGLLWACTGARVCGRTGVQVYGRAGQFQVPVSPFPYSPLASPTAAKRRWVRREVEEEQAYLGFAQRSSDAGSSLIHLSHLLVYSVYPLPLYSFLNLSVYSQTRCEIPFYRHRGRSNTRFSRSAYCFPLSAFPFPFPARFASYFQNARGRSAAGILLRYTFRFVPRTGGRFHASAGRLWHRPW